MDGFMVKRTIGGDDCFVPADETMEKRLTKMGDGEIVTVTIHDDKYRRDPVLHNQFFAILDKCVLSIDHETGVYQVTDNRSMEIAREAFLLYLKKETGFIVYRPTFNPETRRVEEVAYPDSIKFHDCPEPKAEAFRTACYAIMCRIFNCTKADLFDGNFGRY